MKSVLKGLVIGLTLIAVGLAVFLFGFGLNGWTLLPDYTKNVQAYKPEKIELLEFDADAGNIRLQPYDGENIRIEYYTSSLYSVTVSASGNTLNYKSRYRQWSNVFGYSMPESVVYLPQDNLYDIRVDLQTGYFKFSEGAYGKADISARAGAVRLLGQTAFTSFGVNVRAGAFNADNLVAGAAIISVTGGATRVNRLECGNISLVVRAAAGDFAVTGSRGEYNTVVTQSAGSCNIDSHAGSQNKDLNIRITAGTVNVRFY